MNENVNHPAHYTQGGVECIDAIEAATRGSCSTAIANGNDSIALANGYAAKAKAALGCYIVLTEYINRELVDCQCRKVDGEKIKPDTFYKLVGGEFVEAEE